MMIGNPIDTTKRVGRIHFQSAIIQSANGNLPYIIIIIQVGDQELGRVFIIRNRTGNFR